MSAFELAMVRFAKNDLIHNGGINIDVTFPRRVVREAWRQARVVMGV